MFIHLLSKIITVRLLYDISVRFYFLAARVMGLFDAKARRLVSGRKDLFPALERMMKAAAGRKVLWFHCSSVGEFEQARPLIVRMRQACRDSFILVTFFSPSGYELRKDFNGVDAVSYLPMDTARNAERFLDVVRPSVAVFVKYEFWYHFITSLKRRDVPVYIVSAIFRRGQLFFRPWGSVMRKMLRCYSTLFVQNEESRRLLEGIGVGNVVVAGDTRFDQVKAICEANGGHDAVIEAFVGDGQAWVAGSTWEGDEKVIAGVLDKVSKARLVLVPHEVRPSRLADIRREFQGYPMVFYSECEGLPAAALQERVARARMLVVDRMGILPLIYKYGVLAYVGGGFSRSGIHNILEAAIYGVPVIFGPHFGKFQEAKDLVVEGGAFYISSSAELAVLLGRFLDGSGALDGPAGICAGYVGSHLGASDIIVEHIRNQHKI